VLRGWHNCCLGLSLRGVCARTFQSGPPHVTNPFHPCNMPVSIFIPCDVHTATGWRSLPPHRPTTHTHSASCTVQGKGRRALCCDISGSLSRRVRPVGKHLFPCGEATLSASRTCHQLGRMASTRYTRAMGGDDGREGGSCCTVVRVPSAFCRNHRDLHWGRT
jgi:hypothetical protein